MKVIYKYSLDERNSFHLPVDFKILSVQIQNGSVCVWALVDTEAPTKTVLFPVYGTGHKLPDDPGVYIGTVQDDNFVWHIFMKAFDETI